MYIDFHTHAFADKIAGRAMEALSATSGLKPYTDGTLCGLKKSSGNAILARRSYFRLRQSRLSRGLSTTGPRILTEKTVYIRSEACIRTRTTPFKR